MLLLTTFIFSLSYAVKGGWGNFSGIISGKGIAAFLVFILCALQSNDVFYALKWAAAWILAVHPSIGEEAGAIGRISHWWGKYRDRGFDRMYGVLKGVQRGAWMGAVFTVAGATTLSIPIMGIGFVAAYFVGQEVYWRIHKKDSWAYAEPLIGLLLGFCHYL